mmetsp:Transcript_20083/g.41027  ORF Transcript_20083/g.41027 Transcript_20083/m.41027 type:complete len:92 (+) Transcript_20083:151-426(+)
MVRRFVPTCTYYVRNELIVKMTKSFNTNYTSQLFLFDFSDDKVQSQKVEFLCGGSGSSSSKLGSSTLLVVKLTNCEGGQSLHQSSSVVRSR